MGVHEEAQAISRSSWQNICAENENTLKTSVAKEKELSWLGQGQYTTFHGCVDTPMFRANAWRGDEGVDGETMRVVRSPL